MHTRHHPHVKRVSEAARENDMQIKDIAFSLITKLLFVQTDHGGLYLYEKIFDNVFSGTNETSYTGRFVRIDSVRSFSYGVAKTDPKSLEHQNIRWAFLALSTTHFTAGPARLVHASLRWKRYTVLVKNNSFMPTAS